MSPLTFDDKYTGNLYNEGMNTTLRLPGISSHANKYTRGSLLVIAGSKRYFGAGVLATLAAERAGAGYVSLATPVSAAPAARQHLLCSPVIEGAENQEQGCFAATALPAILSELRHVDALCCGPGLTASEDTATFVKDVLQYATDEDIPLLLDADALNILAQNPELLGERRSSAPLILTPHEGELARLYTSLTMGTNQEISYKEGGSGHAASTPRLCVPVAEAAQALAEGFNAVIVAKGPTTYIAGSGELHESNEATAALAKAGTGDVLAGIIGSLLAQGIDTTGAVRLGVSIHSLAGRYAEQEQGLRSVTALDVVNAIPQAVLEVES